ncbi:MAG: hypothetical protein IID18_05185, partial [Nitrospinae bacterium]|nr:hypothetical protein [Nitrospinota bacterium]
MDLLEAKDAALSYLKTSNTEVLKWFRTEISVETKADQSPVTIADRNAEEILRKKLSQAFPDHGIIGEEFGSDRAEAEWVWTIDPIDGTRSFIHGIPLFATLLALLHNGQPVMGIISLLISILASSLVKARAAAKGFVCKNNLKTVAFEFNLFADDLIFPASETDYGRRDKRLTIEAFQERIYGINAYWDVKGASRAKIEARQQPLVCPEGPQELEKRAGIPCRQFAVGPAENISVGFNMRLDRASLFRNNMWILQPIRLNARILARSDVPLAFDVDGGNIQQEGAVPYYAAPPAKDQGQYGDGGFWHPSFRHAGQLNAAFIGGHVLSSSDPTTEPSWNWAYQPPV